MIVTATKKYTPEDLLMMPKDNRYELVDGELVEKNVGFASDLVGGRVYSRLDSFCQEHSVGRAAPEASYQCFPDAPNKVRRPDASFVSFERMPANQSEPEGHCRVAPNIAVEVISPNDLYSEVEEKVTEYLNANVQLVWVIDPPNRSVRVHRADGTVTDLSVDGELSGEDVLPGFRCPVAALFPSPAPQEPVNGHAG